MRLARTTSNGGSPLGTLPARVSIRPASRFRAALAGGRSPRSGPDRGRRHRPRRGARQRSRGCPSPPPTSERRRRAARATPRSSATRSRAARQRRVVGCSPVPKAIPGSRAMTTSPCRRRWRRQVGRMTSRRPTRRTGKWAFQAVAQSASWTTRVSSSPIGRSPNAWRWPRARRRRRDRRLGDARIGAPAGRPGRSPASSRRWPRDSPSSTRTKAGSTLVPPGATRPRISLTASTASMSAPTESSIQVPSADVPSPRRPRAASAEGIADAVDDPAVPGRPDLLARRGRVASREPPAPPCVSFVGTSPRRARGGRRETGRGGGAARPCPAAGSRSPAGCPA